MMKNNLLLKNLALAALFAIASCANDDSNIITPEGENPNPDPVNLAPEVEIYNADKIHNNLTLAVNAGDNSAFLLNKTGQKVKEFTFDEPLGNDLEILPNGKILGVFKDPNAQIQFGGYGGIVKIMNINGTVEWEYTLSNADFVIHHDVEMLPNGNVLLLVWERIPEAIASSQGSTNPGDIYPEKLIEIDPNTDTIVWEWRSYDHIIQDDNPSLPNFGNVSQHPHKININYNPIANGDIMHGNGIDYDANKDVIYLSINFFSEVWVIDHSTTTSEAATGSGGNYGKGGDLVYRFGNPRAYDNMMGEVRGDRNHYPNLLEDGVQGEGNILLYVNGFAEGVSTVYELEMPTTFSLTPDTDNEPNVVWFYKNPAIFSGKISGAERLTNGNTLICEGDFGFWEVTPTKELVWRYNGGNGSFFWRAYDYDVDDPVLAGFGL
ncbi:aryl-sulfate sulfotransferase [Kordia zhangzhouensis]|uniref:aryl-sulfate sulfotransferase n=1 Tax=Kordia zhangzhouensis TaxID=1620405 RepID=UPI0006298B52|nr:aryl-sulfate sulfotransferase [Kordia zhangzhouensis]